MSLLRRYLVAFCRLSVGLVCAAGFCLMACERVPVPHSKHGVSGSSVDVLKSRIVRGNMDLSHPAVGALLSNDVPFCSGTLIAPRVVLTAAHCVTPLKSMKGRTWFFRLDIPTGTSSFRSVSFEMDTELSQAHPQFELIGSIQNDIGYIVLKKPVFLVRPVSMYSKELSSDWLGRRALVMGYGRLAGSAFSTSPTKQSVQLSIQAIEPLDPQTRKPKKNVVLLNSYQRSGCQGDSGGPSLVMAEGETKLLGVSSHISNPTCIGNTFSFLAGPYIKWIQDAITRFSTCSGSSPSCGACGTCDAGSCQWKESTDAESCKECNQNSDCGAGGLCLTLKDGKRCLRPCSGDGCCPSGFVCSQLSGKRGSFCMPGSLSCSSLACQKDADCLSGKVCLEGECKPKGAERHASTCLPCESDADCVKGGTCYKVNGIGGRCYQPCASGSSACPSGFRCESLAGASRCVPDDLTCRIPCNGTTCPSGFVCQGKMCQRQGGGDVGDPCAPDLPCKASLRCALSTLGSRCYRPCGAKAGKVGASCLPGRACDAGLTCVATKTGKEICVELCSAGGAACSQGGTCSGFCVCDQDSDCNPDQYCRRLNLSLGAGVCRPKESTSCPTGEVCTEEDVCVPEKPGMHRVWDVCDPINRCEKGSVCAPELNRCLRACQSQDDCKGFGQCFGESGGFCACTKDADCGQGFRCRPFDKEGPGFCEEVKKTCPPAGCPDGMHCVSGSCVDLTRSVDEPSNEVGGKESGAPDAGSSDAGQDGPQGQSDKDNTDSPNLPSKGCGCSTSSQERGVPWWALLGMLVFVAYSRRLVCR